MPPEGQKKNSPIVVELKTEKSKEEVLKARKNLGRINAKDCHLKGKNNEIFINEQLTRMTSTIFYSAKELKKRKKLNMCGPEMETYMSGKLIQVRK